MTLTHSKRTHAAWILAAMLLPAPALLAQSPAGDDPGRKAFVAYCAPCHGWFGRGDGNFAHWLEPRPRDLSTGEYRWRTTPSGSLPTDADILRTLDKGAFGTSMPAWEKRLPLQTRLALVRYVKTLSPRFGEEEVEAPISIPESPPATRALVERGRKVYERLKCWECHGREGRGDGPSAKTLKDSRGRPMLAYDFTRGYFKAGRSPQTVYRTFMTGLDGTPMPAYDQTIDEADRWPLVYFTLSLARDRGVLDYLFGPLEEQKK